MKRFALTMTLALVALVSSLVSDAATLVSSGEWWLVDQTRTYCGRNENEPLTRVLFNTQNWTSLQTEYEQMISDDKYYAVGFRLHFNAMNQEQLVTKLKAYVKVYPQNVAVMDTDRNVSWTSGNPLRGNQGSGLIGGGCGIDDAIDLGVWDHRAPLNAANQTVYYLGEIASDPADGSYWEVKISPPVAKQIYNSLSKVYNNLKDVLGETQANSYFDPRFYLYICADIDANASTNDGNGKYAQIGAVVEYIKMGPNSWSGVDNINAKSAYWDRWGGTISGDVITGSDRYHYFQVDQSETSRPLLPERVLMFTPYDGYSRYYRIPGLSDLADGTLVVTSDARKYHNHDVRNDFDILSRTSTDNGRTWTNAAILAQGRGLNGTGYECNTTGKDESGQFKVFGYGDCAVCDLTTPGNVLSAYIGGSALSAPADGPSIYYSVSTTSGRSWGEPTMIDPELFTIATTTTTGGGWGGGTTTTTYSIDGYDPSLAVVCPGPGRMLKVEKGHLAGKILLCVYTWVNGGNTYGPLYLLAYDEETNTWERLGYMGRLSDMGWGETQMVQVDDEAFIISSRNEFGGTTTPRRWFLLKFFQDTSGNWHYPEWTSSTSKSLSNYTTGTVTTQSSGGGRPGQGTTTTVWTLQELTNGGSAFGTAAGPCNSNLIVMEALNSSGATEKYLVQTSATSSKLSIGQLGQSSRAGMYIKAAPLSSIISGSSTTLNWCSGKEMSMHQYAACYSCLSAQKDGNIGIVIEEHPLPYRPAAYEDCAVGNRDYLYNIYYYSVPIEFVTENAVQTIVDPRDLVAPDIDPENATFRIEILDTDKATGKLLEGSTRRLPSVTVSVDPDKINILEGEHWRLEFQVYFREAGSTTGSLQALTSCPLAEGSENFAGVSDTYTGYGYFNDNTSVTDFNEVTFDIPGMSAKTDFANRDSYVIVAWVAVYDADGNLTAKSLVNNTGYYAVAPARKLIVKVRPEKVEADVTIRTSLAVAHADTQMYVRPSDWSDNYDTEHYPVDMQAIISDDVKATFLGFNLDGDQKPTTTDTGALNKNDETLLRNQSFLEYHPHENKWTSDAVKIFHAKEYDDTEQLRIYIPNVETLPGDKDDHDCITVYAWFNLMGGIYTEGHTGYIYGDTDDTHAMWSSDAERIQSPSVYKQWPEKWPEPQVDLMEYPDKRVNTANNDLTFHYDYQTEMGYTYIDLVLIPDEWTYSKSGVLAMWEQSPQGVYTASKLSRLLEDSPTECEAIDYMRIVGAESSSKASANDLKWYDSYKLPAAIEHRLMTHHSFPNYEPSDNNDNLGLLSLMLFDEYPTEAEIATAISEVTASLNSGVTSSDDTQANAARRSVHLEATASTSDDNYLYRIDYPIKATYDPTQMTGIGTLVDDTLSDYPVEYYDLMGRRVP
ncbi:MAG: glycoside hydrolase, partial [Bacteroidales bacterium]|nr:glycoside hydrolase [Bacteroidales bacterium]